MKRTALILAIQSFFLASSLGQSCLTEVDDYRDRFTGRFEGVVYFEYRMLQEFYRDTTLAVITVDKFTGYTNGVDSNYLNIEKKVGITFDTTAYSNSYVWCHSPGAYFTVRGYLFPTIDTAGQLTYPELVQCISGRLKGFISKDSINVSYGNMILMEAYAYKIIGIRKASSIDPAPVLNNRISVYPSPASSFIKVEGVENGCSFSILDLTGRTVSTGFMNDYPIYISSFKEGMYILRIKTSAGYRSVKFIKE